MAVASTEVRTRKPGHHARDRERERVAEILRERGGRFLLFFVAWIGVVYALGHFTRVSDALLMLVAITPLWIATIEIASDPKVAGWRAGAEGEQFTADALRKAFGPGAVVVDDVQTGDGNIDHVVIAPQGIIAVETKYSSSRWAARSGRERVDRAARQARYGALLVKRALEADRILAEPRATVVLWGGSVRYWKDDVVARSIARDVVPGPHVDQWVRTLPVDELNEHDIARIAAVVRAMH
jgi:hypothetical protein